MSESPDYLEVRLFPFKWHSAVKFCGSILVLALTIPALFRRGDSITQSLYLIMKVLLAFVAVCLVLAGVGLLIVKWKLPVMARLSPLGASFVNGQLHEWSEFAGYRRIKLKGQVALGFVVSPGFVRPSVVPKSVAAQERLRAQYGVDILLPVTGTNVALSEVVSFVSRYLPELGSEPA